MDKMAGMICILLDTTDRFCYGDCTGKRIGHLDLCVENPVRRDVGAFLFRWSFLLDTTDRFCYTIHGSGKSDGLVSSLSALSVFGEVDPLPFSLPNTLQFG